MSQTVQIGALVPMRRLAGHVLILFAANFVFAALGPHCASGLGLAHAHAAASSATHEHGDADHHRPASHPAQGDLCGSMQLAAVMTAAAIPDIAPIKTKIVVADSVALALTQTHVAVPRRATPPPPLIVSHFDAGHARTGRLLL